MPGSEGALGVITRGRAARAPAAARRRGTRAGSSLGFEAGCEALRALEQAGVAPDVARLSDEDETRLRARASAGAVARGSPRRAVGESLPAGLRLGGRDAARRVAAAARVLRAAGARPLGPQARARRGRRSRFAGPHLRDDLLDRGVLVETLETATSWRNLAAPPRGGPRARCRRHARRLPRLAPVPDRRLAVLHGLRPPATPIRPPSGAPPRPRRRDAIVAAGGTITHHHAVGRDHAPWLAAEVGALGVGCCARVKERCDPAGIMNPGKLLAP